MNEKNKSSHILNTSSQLLGLCFIVLTALKLQNLSEATIIDEITAMASVLFMSSSLFSFLSIRSNSQRAERYEDLADIIFLIGLFVMFFLTMVIVFDVIK